MLPCLVVVLHRLGSVAGWALLMTQTAEALRGRSLALVPALVVPVLMIADRTAAAQALEQDT